jgi:hypothetical protein
VAQARRAACGERPRTGKATRRTYECEEIEPEEEEFGEMCRARHFLVVHVVEVVYQFVACCQLAIAECQLVQRTAYIGCCNGAAGATSGVKERGRGR